MKLLPARTTKVVDHSTALHLLKAQLSGLLASEVLNVPTIDSSRAVRRYWASLGFL